MVARSRRPTGRRAPTRTAKSGSAGRGSRRGQPGGGRMVPQPKKNNTPLIIGACAGGFVLLIIIIAAAASGGGGDTTPAKSGTNDPNRPEPVDVSDLERSGEEWCSKGYRTFQTAQGRFGNSPPVEQHSTAKAEYIKARDEIQKGLAYYEQAMEKSGKKYDLKGYTKAMHELRFIIPGLKD